MMVMFIIDLLGWWYSHGWSWAVRHLFFTRSQHIVQFFSVSDLLKTLFAPFRQDIVHGGTSVGLKLQALGNNIISRFFGFFLRLALIMCGLVLLTVNAVFAIAGVIIWPLLPLSPVVAFILMGSGVGNV
jgi:hypothetical protein